MESFTKPNWNLCVDKCLTYPEKIHDKILDLWKINWRNSEPVGTKRLYMNFYKALKMLLTGERVKPHTNFTH